MTSSNDTERTGCDYMAQKRYYWLKLQDGFFNSKRIKKLRKLAGGDTYTIIYLKMQLLAMKTDGILRWTGLEDNFAAELALDLDEEPENVAVTMQYLLSCGLAETDDNTAFFLPYAVENVGSECSSAKRVREHRERKALLGNDDVTPMKRLRNVESEIEKDIEKEIEIDKEIEEESSSERRPTFDDVKSFALQENLTHVDPEEFYIHYKLVDWTDKDGKPINDWKRVMRASERNAIERGERNKSVHGDAEKDIPFPDIPDEQLYTIICS